MKKAAGWIAAITLLLFVVVWGVLGLKIMNGEYDIALLTWIGAACLIGFLVSILVLRWNSWKCPHCGKLRWSNGCYCSYCGRKI